MLKILNSSFVILLMLVNFQSHAAAAGGKSKSMASKPSVKKQDLYFTVSAGLQSRWERDESQEYRSRAGVVPVSVGFEYKDWMADLKYSTFSSTSSEGTTTIERTHNDIYIEAGYDTFHFAGDSLRLVSRLGLGMFQERVKTKMGAADEVSMNGNFAMGTVGFDLEVLFVNHHAALGFGGRAIVSDDLDPNPMPVAAGYLKILF